ncbi:MAG: VTT domain-containing protein [Gemmatimonadota bacterium]|nr:VTT domain-containing protein [Gemmatimonadota bacterium]
MDRLIDLFHWLTDVRALVQWGGYVGLTGIVFVETGLLVGFFLPGDSLLVTAGLFASQPQFGLNVYLLGVILSAAAIAGDSLGYAIGRATGPRIFTREDSLLFNKRHLYRAQDFYERHGGKTIVIARFVPIIRTFAPVVAGVGQMKYRSFVFFNVIGGLLWIWSMLFTGYFLGRYIPGIDEHIELVIIVVVFLSILPGIIHWYKERKRPVPVPAAGRGGTRVVSEPAPDPVRDG